MLDIIIPSYKNLANLKKSLESINVQKGITITVVDDCSNVDYNEIQKQFPHCNYFFLERNVGPGNARQFGIEHTSEPYIYFLDSGDKFLILEKVLQTIVDNPEVKMFSWRYLTERKTLSVVEEDKTAGYIYLRDFIEKYNIYFCEEGSYANEDLGFIRSCKLILTSLGEGCFKINEAIVEEDASPFSITRINDGSFLYTKCIKGIR